MKAAACMVAVAGCVAQAEGEEIIARAPVVDIVVGPQSYHRLPALIARAEQGKVVDTEFPVEDKFDALKAPSREATRARGVAAFVTVQEGCDKFCTFCVVPYTRGAEVSRPVMKIVAEVERLADAGVREVTLIGQNVNAYHGEGPDGPWTLGRLLHRVAEVPGIARLRYTTSHPRDMDDSLIAAHRDLPSLMPQLHLPVQSGSDRILAAMNRRHTRSRISRGHRTPARGAAGHRVLIRLHRRLSRRERGGFLRYAPSRRRGRLCERLLVQIFATPGNAGRRNGAGAGAGESPAAGAPAGARSTVTRRPSMRNASA